MNTEKIKLSQIAEDLYEALFALGYNVTKNSMRFELATVVKFLTIEALVAKVVSLILVNRITAKNIFDTHVFDNEKIAQSIMLLEEIYKDIKRIAVNNDMLDSDIAFKQAQQEYPAGSVGIIIASSRLDVHHLDNVKNTSERYQKYGVIQNLVG